MSDVPEVVVSESGAGLFSQEIKIGSHHLTADEPVNVGGKDLGPSPYDFLMVSLGTCTSMTVRMYAKLKAIPLEKITVHLTHDKIYDEDCKHCENENSKIDHINVVLELAGNLTPEQSAKLLAIANQCPVHRTLTSKIVINTQLKKEDGK